MDAIFLLRLLRWLSSIEMAKASSTIRQLFIARGGSLFQLQGKTPAQDVCVTSLLTGGVLRDITLNRNPDKNRLTFVFGALQEQP